jgi:chemotaxis signal transduction protein
MELNGAASSRREKNGESRRQAFEFRLTNNGVGLEIDHVRSSIGRTDQMVTKYASGIDAASGFHTGA